MDVHLINDYRAQIDALDVELLSLLSRRARIACEVAQVKRQSGVPILDSRRERAILARVRQDNPGPLDAASIARIFSCIIEESRRAAGSASGCA